MKWLVWPLRFALIGGLAVHLATLDWVEAGQYFSWKTALALLVTQPFVVFSFFLLGIRFKFIPACKGVSLRQALDAYVFSVGMNLLVPARLSELVKPAYLRQAAQVPLSVGSSALVAEKVFDLFAVGLISLAAVLLVGFGTEALPVIVAACLAAFCVPLAAAWLSRRLPTAETHARVPALLIRMVHVLAETSRPKVYAGLFGCSLGGWFASAFSLYALVAICGTVPLGLGKAVVVFVCTLVGGLFALLPAGIGTYQAAAIFALTQFGFPTEEATILSVLLQVQAMAFAVLYTAVRVAQGAITIPTRQDFRRDDRTS